MFKQPYWQIFGKRFLLALVLVLITYNIWGFSYFHWATGNFEGLNNFMGALKIVVGMLLAVCYIILVWATLRAKGPIGIGILFAVLFGFVWLMQLAGVINLHDPNTGIIVVQLVMAIALAIGSTWSIFWRKITGQVAVEDPDTIEEA